MRPPATSVTGVLRVLWLVAYPVPQLDLVTRGPALTAAPSSHSGTPILVPWPLRTEPVTALSDLSEGGGPLINQSSPIGQDCVAALCPPTPGGAAPGHVPFHPGGRA